MKHTSSRIALRLLFHVFFSSVPFRGVIVCYTNFFCFSAKKYDAFLASESLIKLIPRILGPGLAKAGKFPSPIGHNDAIVGKVEDVRSTIKFQMKKVRVVWRVSDGKKAANDDTHVLAYLRLMKHVQL